MRGHADAAITECASKMWRSWNASNNALQHRVSETKEAYNRLQSHISRTNQEIYDQEKHIAALKRAIYDKEAPLKVSTLYVISVAIYFCMSTDNINSTLL